MLEYIVNGIVTSFNLTVATAKWVLILMPFTLFMMILLVFKTKVERGLDRLSQEVQTKDWFKEFMIFVHGKEYYAEYEIVELPITHNKRRAEIKYKDKMFLYKKETNEVKLLDLLIKAKGEIVTYKEIVTKLDMTRSFEANDTNTTGYRKDIYELVSRLRALLIKELKIKKGEVNQLISTVKERGYRIGNPKN